MRQSTKSPDEKLVSSLILLSKKGYLLCVRGHADMVQDFATCATQWLGGSRDVSMGDGVRDDWETSWGEKRGSP